MRQATVTCTWKTTHTVEVADDFTTPDYLDGFPEDVLEELTPDAAELVDWEVS